MTGLIMVTKGGGCGGGGVGATNSPAPTQMATAMATTTTKTTKGGVSSEQRQQEEQQNQLSLVALLLAALRKSMVSCRVDRREEVISTTVNHHHHHIDVEMDIGWPTNVKHISHVTFDRFHGFLGLPVEFQVEIPTKVPSASVSVFGVSAESMQCSFDTKGNSVPIILLLMQERLYSQGGLKAEGIFRINPENSQEQVVRDQLNRGIVPDDIDVHCLAGLIKTWFRELPSGVLDGLSPEEVLQCNTEEDYIVLVKQLKPMEAALLNWAIDLMADVVEEEDLNKMNARNIAMVFAPNMTQMSDPLTALMHAVQVMNLLKTLITKTLREREEAVIEDNYSPMSSPSSGQESDEECDEEYDSHQEMDNSYDSRGNASDYDESADYSHKREYDHEQEAGSLSDIEECFLRQLDRNKVVSSRTDEAEMVMSDSKTWNHRSSDSKSLSERYENVKDVEMDQLVERASSMPLLVNS